MSEMPSYDRFNLVVTIFVAVAGLVLAIGGLTERLPLGRLTGTGLFVVGLVVFVVAAACLLAMLKTAVSPHLASAFAMTTLLSSDLIRRGNTGSVIGAMAGILLVFNAMRHYGLDLRAVLRDLNTRKRGDGQSVGR